MKRFFVITTISIILLIIIAYGINEVSKSRSFQFFGGLITKVETTDKVVALTFDDGPGKNTDEILGFKENR